MVLIELQLALGTLGLDLNALRLILGLALGALRLTLDIPSAQ